MKFTRLLQFVTPHRSTLLAVLVLLLADSLIALSQPWIAGKLTAAVLEENSNITAIQKILFLWLGIIALKSIFSFFSNYLIGSTGEDMAAKLRSRVYQHMQDLPLGYFTARRTGETLSLLTNDAEIISNFVTSTLVTLLPLLLTFFGAFFLMLRLEPQIALIAVLLLPVYFVAMKLLGRKISHIAKDWIKAWSEMVSLVEENLRLIPIIKSFTRENREVQRFDEQNEQLLKHSKQQILKQTLLTPAISFLAGAGLLLLLWIGIGYVHNNEVSTAELVSILLYAMLMTRPISGLANVYGQVMRTRGAAERLLDFFAEQTEPRETSLPVLENIKGKISFENVNFAYPGRGPLINDFNLEIPAGETIAFTGLNGAGKTTLVHLLMRFLEPDAGRITIDGHDISQYSLPSVRNAIGLVAQHTLLLNASVAENICYGSPDANKHEIEKAAKAAGAHVFINQLPKGYDTTIGDQGIRLSGGQRQRLSLARTLLKDPPILILDEATAMFDPQGELDFIEECSDLLKERTVILITHRPASLALADKVVKLQVSKGVPKAQE